MKYMLLIYMAENAMTEDERQDCYKKSTDFAHELQAKGQFLATAPLQPASTATSVRMREGKRLVTDGPFAETRELLGRLLPGDCRESRRSYRNRRADSGCARGYGGNPPGAGDPRFAGNGRRPMTRKMNYTLWTVQWRAGTAAAIRGCG